jgi:hypothetical protein
MMPPQIQEVLMSQSNEVKEIAKELAAGLRRLGPNRVAALSVHKSKELIEELEAKANKLVELVEA